MGEAIAKGLQKSNSERKESESLAAIPTFAIQATTKTPQMAKTISARLELDCHTNPLKLVETSDVIVLCVKPNQAQAVLELIGPALTRGKLLVSVCASITSEKLAQWSGGTASVIRSMPNTPSLVGEGMTILCRSSHSDEEQLKMAEMIFNTLGLTVVIEENLIDGATGLSGCGPAYGYLMIEALSDAGVRVGLSRHVATLAAAQVLLGAAKMVLKTGLHPAVLKDQVTTPGGCTIQGLIALEHGNLRSTLINGVLTATERSRELTRML